MSTYYRGSTVSVSVTVTDSGTGLPVDLTGATVKFRLAQTLGANATYEAAMTVTTPTNQATLTIPAATALTLSGAYQYTVHVTEAAGTVFIAAQGQLTFTNIVLTA